MENITNGQSSGDSNIDSLFGGEPGSGDPSTGMQTNVDAANSGDIDNIFGLGTSDDGAGSGKPAGDKSSDGDSGDAQPDYSGMNPEQLARKFQSDYDKTKAQLDAATKRLQNFESVEGFINSLYEDGEVRRAFIAELEPELIKPADPYDVLQERLTKEFGVDFVPDDDEARKPFSPSWKWYKRVDDLTKELSEKGNKSTPSSLKELREARLAKKQMADQTAQEEKAKVLSTMKWDDGRYSHFANWVGKLSATDLAKIYSYAMTKSTGRPPSLGGQSSSNVPSDIKSELDKFFGK